MSKLTFRKQFTERCSSPKEKAEKTSPGLLSKHLKRIYPIGLQRSTSSSYSLSSLSLSLSQNSNDSSLTDSSSSPLDQKISLALRLIAPVPRKKEAPVPKIVQQQQSLDDDNPGELRRCNSEKPKSRSYKQRHVEAWVSLCGTCDSLLLHASSWFDH